MAIIVGGGILFGTSYRGKRIVLGRDYIEGVYEKYLGKPSAFRRYRIPLSEAEVTVGEGGRTCIVRKSGKGIIALDPNTYSQATIQKVTSFVQRGVAQLG